MAKCRGSGNARDDVQSASSVEDNVRYKMMIGMLPIVSNCFSCKPFSARKADLSHSSGSGVRSSINVAVRKPRCRRGIGSRERPSWERGRDTAPRRVGARDPGASSARGEQPGDQRAYRRGADGHDVAVPLVPLHTREIEDRIDLRIAQPIAYRLGIRSRQGRRTGGKVVQGLGDAVRIDQRDGRTAVRARGCVGKVDGRAALRAGNLAHGGTELGELDRRKRANEILLAQKVVKRDEPAVIVAAPPVREACRALQVMRQGERRGTSGAIELAR